MCILIIFHSIYHYDYDYYDDHNDYDAFSLMNDTDDGWFVPALKATWILLPRLTSFNQIWSILFKQVDIYVWKRIAHILMGTQCATLKWGKNAEGNSGCSSYKRTHSENEDHALSVLSHYCQWQNVINDYGLSQHQDERNYKYASR